MFTYIHRMADKTSEVLIGDKVVTITNPDGTKCIDEIELLHDFSNNFAKVTFTNNTYNWINKQGRLLTSDKFWFAGNFCCDYAPVSITVEDNWNWLHISGKFLNNEKYLWTQQFTTKGFAEFRTVDDMYRTVDTLGLIFKHPTQAVYVHNGIDRLFFDGSLKHYIFTIVIEN